MANFCILVVERASDSEGRHPSVGDKSLQHQSSLERKLVKTDLPTGHSRAMWNFFLSIFGWDGVNVHLHDRKLLGGVAVLAEAGSGMNSSKLMRSSRMQAQIDALGSDELKKQAGAIQGEVSQLRGGAKQAYREKINVLSSEVCFPVLRHSSPSSSLLRTTMPHDDSWGSHPPPCFVRV